MNAFKKSLLLVAGLSAYSLALGPCGQRKLATGIEVPGFNTAYGFVQNATIYAQFVGGDIDNNTGNFPNGAVQIQFLNPANNNNFYAILPLDWDWAQRLAGSFQAWRTANKSVYVKVCKDAAGTYYIEQAASY